MDYGFPNIIYEVGKTYRQWGQAHGESYPSAICELAEIRKNLMLNKNPKIGPNLSRLSELQLKSTQKYFPSIYEELVGISEGANISLEKLVILNNYTDFRDINLTDEGCTSLSILHKNHIISAQTWDMHKSAKNFLCTLEIQGNQTSPKMYMLSLLGCPGLMGINERGQFVGVNNINTHNAQAQTIWPLFVRGLLEQSNYQEMESLIKQVKVTSGHNYLISDEKQASNWEVTPTQSKKVGQITKNEYAPIFHTNHCLHEDIIKEENKNAISATTHSRMNLAKKHIPSLTDVKSIESFLKSHEGSPKSICSHYDAGGVDPSATCGGGIFNTKDKDIIFWRGCEKEDQNYMSRHFNL